MEQLLLATSCDSPAGIGASLRTDGRTHRRDIGNSILDVLKSTRCTQVHKIPHLKAIFNDYETSSEQGHGSTFNIAKVVPHKSRT